MSCVTHLYEEDTMTRGRLPLVSNNHVLGLDGAGEKIAPVVVGSGAWYTWLADQQIQSFSFRNLLGSFTARRERKRHGWYWYAYRKRAGRLRKAYLGKTEELTLERLNAVALVSIAKWNQLHRPLQRIQLCSDEANNSRNGIIHRQTDAVKPLPKPILFRNGN